MDQNQYSRVREVFERLAPLPVELRAAELDRTFAPGDPNRREVEQLLAASDALAQRPDVTVTEIKPRPSLAAGQVLASRYRLERLLGTGGFSQAYLATDEQLHGKQVVVKIPLRNSNESSEWFARHFTDEIRALAALNHPGIVHVLDSAADPVYGDFFTEQFIAGPTLSEILKKEPPLGLNRSARILERVARALAAAHAKGVVHRDLKPHNILVHMPGTHEETPVLIDFGIASLLGPEETRGSSPVETRVAGTPDYLAPEQMLGRVLPESDIYALGCIAIELLTSERLNARMAKRPLGELPEQSAIVMLREKLPELSEEVRARLAKLVSIEPASRGSAAELAAGLFRELTPAPTPAPAPAVVTRRHWTGLAVAGGAVGIVAWGLSRRSTAPAPPPPVMLRLQLKLNRAANKTGKNELISPVDGVVTRNHKVRLEVELTPAGFCYVFAESLTGGAAAGDLLALYPPEVQASARGSLTVPSTAADWIVFDNKPELLRLLLVAGLQPIPEAAEAVRKALSQPEGALRDPEVRRALESRIRQAPAAEWRAGESGVWTAASSGPVLCVEGRLQHVGV